MVKCVCFSVHVGVCVTNSCRGWLTNQPEKFTPRLGCVVFFFFFKLPSFNCKTKTAGGNCQRSLQLRRSKMSEFHTNTSSQSWDVTVSAQSCSVCERCYNRLNILPPTNRKPHRGKEAESSTLLQSSPHHSVSFFFCEGRDREQGEGQTDVESRRPSTKHWFIGQFGPYTRHRSFKWNKHDDKLMFL